MMFDASRFDVQPRTAAESLRALDKAASLFRSRGDARAAFPDIYAIITRRVAEEIARPDGIFLEPAWISRLSGRFCEAYLETLRHSLRGEAQPCEAWELAYWPGREGASLPVEDAVLGLSAHINYDLALGIYENIMDFGHAEDARMLARYKHDHDRVNDLLRESVFEALERLIERHRCELSEVVYRQAPVTARWLAMVVLRRWRAQVWDTVLAMLAARRAEERERVVAAMGRRAAWIARLLTLPSAAWIAGRPLLAGVSCARGLRSPSPA